MAVLEKSIEATVGYFTLRILLSNWAGAAVVNAFTEN